MQSATLTQPATAPSRTKPLIQLQRVTKIFRGKGLETHALSGVDLDLFRGEYVAVAGPSGCGKSTLLSIMGLLDDPSEGQYLLDGEPVSGLKRNQKAKIRSRRIGFIFQNFNLIGDMNVFENVALPLRYQFVPPNERRERVEAALERVGLIDRAAYLPNQLSGGQQQRAAVARALIVAPDILLADEPTGNLDSQHGMAIMDLLSTLHREGATICLVTHDPRYLGYANRQIEMLDGRIVGETSADA